MQGKTHAINFVCHGTICRSPMAEFLFKDMLKKAGREREFIVVSSAVSDEEIYNGVGAPVYPPVKKLLAEKGISCEGKRAKKLVRADGEQYDLFLCMDDSNVARAKRIVGEQNAHKCKKLLSYANDSSDVADPWYTRDFNECYQDILRGLTALLQSL